MWAPLSPRSLLQPPSSATNDKTAACDAEPSAVSFTIFDAKELDVSNTTNTVIVTGGSQGIGAGAVKAFLDRGYNVVATSRNVTKSKDLPSSPRLVMVDGDIGDAATAARAAKTAIDTFGSIDALVNNAGVF